MDLIEASPTHLCEAHGFHQPSHMTVEYHHVIPVAWQLHTATPATPPSPGPDPDGRGMLWDNRTAWLCPTGHRNVHFYIVRFMHAVADHADEVSEITAEWIETEIGKVVHAGLPERGMFHPREFKIAEQALLRLLPYGDLLALTQAGEWGQI